MSVETLNPQTDNPETQVDEEPTIDEREISPVGSFLSRAAGRITDFSDTLATRRVNNAHTKALKEYRTSDHQGYTEHLTAMAEGEDSSLDARDYGQKQLTREGRLEQLHSAEDTVRSIGTTALEVTIGSALLGAEGVARGARLTRDKAKSATETGKRPFQVAAKNARSMELAATNRRQSRHEKRDTRRQARQTRTEELVQNRITQKKERRQKHLKETGERRQAAIDRRQGRHSRREARRQMATEFFQGTGGAVKRTAERAKNRIDTNISVKRAAGAAALKAYRETRRTHAEQNKLY